MKIRKVKRQEKKIIVLPTYVSLLSETLFMSAL